MKGFRNISSVQAQLERDLIAKLKGASVRGELHCGDASVTSFSYKATALIQNFSTSRPQSDGDWSQMMQWLRPSKELALGQLYLCGLPSQSSVPPALP